MRLAAVTVALVLLTGTHAASADFPIAATPVVSVSEAGTAAAAWIASSSRDSYGAVRILVAVGRPGALGLPVSVAAGTLQPRPGLAVVAQRDGGARVLWSAYRADLREPKPVYTAVLRSVLVASDGRPGPVEDVAVAYDARVATNARGDALAAWTAGSGRVEVASAGAGGAFTRTSVPASDVSTTPPLTALAANGAAAVAVSGEVLVRPPGGSFAAPLRVPFSIEALSIASDGTVAVGGRGPRNRVAVRPPGAGFGGPVLSPDDSEVVVGAVAGGGVVFLPRYPSVAPAVYDLQAGTSIPAARELAGWPGGELLLAAGEDGSAVVAGTGPRLWSRPGAGAFAGPLTLTPAARDGLSLSGWPGGVLVGWSDSDERETRVVANGQVLATYPEPRLDPDPQAAVPLRIARRVTVRRRVARVPVRCVGSVCVGTMQAAGGPRARFRLTENGGAVVRVRVPRGARRVVLRLRFEGGLRARRRRALLRSAPVREHCAAPWARGVAADGDVRLFDQGRPGVEGSGSDLVLCAPGTPAQVLASRGGRFQSFGAVAVSRRWAAATLLDYPRFGSPSVTLLWRDLLTGATERLVLQPPLTGLGVIPVRLLLADSGAAVLLERVEGQLRVRLVSGTFDRVLDAEPGIDAASLRLDGTSVAWTRDGVPQRAELP